MASDTKQCKCTKCGKMTTVTKFASASKVVCDNCKGGVSAPSAPAAKPAEGATKICKCVSCGADVQVTKFATPGNVRCNACKGNGGPIKPKPRRVSDDDDSDITPLNINLASDIFSDEDLLISPSLISNPRLRDLKCPACEDSWLKIVKIQDSTMWGDIIVYQCPKCKDLIYVDEQCKTMMPPMKKHESFDYRGETLKEFTSALTATRARNAIEYLMGLCEKHGINIDGMGVFANGNEATGLLSLQGNGDGIQVCQPSDVYLPDVQEGPQDGPATTGASNAATDGQDHQEHTRLTGAIIDTRTGEVLGTAINTQLPTVEREIPPVSTSVPTVRRIISLSGR